MPRSLAVPENFGVFPTKSRRSLGSTREVWGIPGKSRKSRVLNANFGVLRSSGYTQVQSRGRDVNLEKV